MQSDRPRQSHTQSEPWLEERLRWLGRERWTHGSGGGAQLYSLMHNADCVCSVEGMLFRVWGER